MTKPRISVLLPTRGRRELLKASLTSLWNHAADPAGIQLLLGFDNDDADSIQYFQTDIKPELETTGMAFSVLSFDPMGYNSLHRYLNSLAKHARADWWVFWNDDAEMIDRDWDQVIIDNGKEFCIQAFDTHRQHPYSIFPIVPRAWWEVLGHLSQHPLNDAYISQIAWMLDIMKRIPVRVEHNRFDLTGKNRDTTFMQRHVERLEGNSNNPKDFNHIQQRRIRQHDANKLAKYLHSKGRDMTFWNNVCQQRQDPWAKMLAADINNQMMRIKP